jgi:sensor histidine kinase YesM
MTGNISKHINSESLREVYRINNLISGMALIFSFSYLLLDHYKMPYIGFKSGVYIFLTSYSQAFILRYCTLKYSNKPREFQIYRYILGFVFGIILYFVSWVVFDFVTGFAPRFNEARWIIIYIMIAVFLNFIIFILHDFVIFRRAKINADLENYRLQMRNKEAENLILKQQVHPHFLFNALNTLKVLYKKDTAMGEQYLLRLSDFLRVAVSHSKMSTSIFQEELDICINYLEMQKIRFGSSIIWEIFIDDENSLKKGLPSFSLQPLLENAIKHNSLTVSTPLVIKIRQYQNQIEITNNINKKNYTENSLKSGLSNLAERYRILTGEDIVVSNNNGIFSVSFKFIQS